MASDVDKSAYSKDDPAKLTGKPARPTPTEAEGDELEKRVEHGKEDEEPKLAEDQASVAGTD